ncbi:MAG: hypothetical protein M1822_006280 [Bathelium mastoideum]|nr:MAG: hypothetical protein M1822_006280 [Bathelium mastoideum]
MVMYNRRKRTAYFQEMEELRRQKLVEARSALARGQANEDQMLLINQERAAEEAQRAREEKKKEGFNTKVWKFVTRTSGASKLEEASDQTATAPLAQAGQPNLTGGEQQSLGIVQAVEEKRREGEKPVERLQLPGGPLDQQAQDNANFVTGSVKGWANWITRK